MALYEYRCSIHGTYLVQRRADFDYCSDCGRESRRVWSLQIAPVMQAHMNISTGTMISDPRQFERELRDKSERQTERTGIPHNYVAVDHSDRQALKVTDAGLQTTYDAGVRSGQIAPGTKPIL